MGIQQQRLGKRKINTKKTTPTTDRNTIQPQQKHLSCEKKSQQRAQPQRPAQLIQQKHPNPTHWNPPFPNIVFSLKYFNPPAMLPGLLEKQHHDHWQEKGQSRPQIRYNKH